MQETGPLLVSFLAVFFGIPVLATAAENVLGQAVAAVVVLKFPGSLSYVLKRDPGRGELHRSVVHDDVGRVLVNVLLRALLEREALEEERLVVEDRYQEVRDRRREQRSPGVLVVHEEIDDSC